MGVVITVLCEGHDHRLEFRADGTIHMLDHDERVVRGFVAFGAKPPPCMEAIDEARDEPISFLVEHLAIDDRTLGFLACDFAEHVLPIWEEEHPDDDRPRKAIRAARRYLRDKIKLSTLDKARAAARSAREASAARSAARSAAWSAAWAADSAWSASSAAASSAAWAVEAAPTSSAWSAAEAAYRHADSVGDDPDSAREAEKKWQVVRAVKVVETVGRGKGPLVS